MSETESKPCTVPDDTTSHGTRSEMPTYQVSCGRRGDRVNNDAIWPTDNEWGVPLLRLDMQATEVVRPFTPWGQETRKSRMRGTFHFYVDDYKFTTLLSKPHHLSGSACTAAVECNFSVDAQMPRAMALHAVYQKRRLARIWQELGKPVIVDLNVASEHADLNLLGIPQGWRAFATRGSVHRLEDIARELDTARTIAGTREGLLFICYGGGKAVEEACRREGVLWFAEAQDEERKR